jgi:hypothetical protein
VFNAQHFFVSNFLRFAVRCWKCTARRIPMRGRLPKNRIVPSPSRTSRSVAVRTSSLGYKSGQRRVAFRNQ